MVDTPLSRRRPQWRWLVLIAILVVFDVLLLGVQRGECVDYAGAAAGQSTCTVGPGPGEWVFAVISLVVGVHAAHRFVRSARR